MASGRALLSNLAIELDELLPDGPGNPDGGAKTEVSFLILKTTAVRKVKYVCQGKCPKWSEIQRECEIWVGAISMSNQFCTRHDKSMTNILWL
jgi:hypothetical protein